MAKLSEITESLTEILQKGPVPSGLELKESPKEPDNLLAEALKKNTTHVEVEVPQNLGSKNTILLVNALVEGNSPNIMYTNFRKVLASDAPILQPALQKLNELCDSNKDKAITLFEKIRHTPELLSKGDLEEIRKRLPAIVTVAERMLRLNEEQIGEIFRGEEELAHIERVKYAKSQEAKR